MPDALVDTEVSAQQNTVGPDLFGFYTREIVDLLTLDDALPLSSSRSKDAVNISPRVLENSYGSDKPSHLSSLFTSSLDDAIPGVKKELLKATMREGARALTQEVDEMIDPVMRIRNMFSCLRSKKQPSEGKAVLGMDSPSPPCKKQKIASSNDETNSFAVQNKDAEKETGEFDEDVKFLLENVDSVQLEETLTKHSDDLDVMLIHMEQKLEELLDAVTSKCRLMTRQEKQQLAKLIQMLPPKNLDRIVEIIHRGQSSSVSSDEIFVELEEQGNGTLWRLYFYVKAVENARKLSA